MKKKKKIGYDDSADLRKRAEEAQRENKERYRSFFENAAVAVAIVDPDGYVVEANDTDCRFLGYSHSELIGMHFTQFTHPQDIDLDVDLFQSLMSGQRQSYEVEKRYVRKDGEVVWGRLAVSLIRGSHGLPSYTSVVCYDITERKQAEEVLRESEEKYRNLVERANDGIVIVQDGIVKYINARLAEMRGVTVEEVIGTPFTDHIYPDELPEVVDRYKQRMAGEDVSPIYETALRRRDGSKIHAELNAGMVTYQGKPADLVIIRDITERKRAEEVLRYQAVLLTNTYDAIIASDEHYRLTAWNAAAESLYGWKAEEVLGRLGLDVAQTEFPGVEKSEMLRTITEIGYWRGEVTQARKDGTRIPVEVASIVLHDESGRVTGYLSVNRDITERKRAEEEIRRKAKDLQEKNAELTRFTYAVSHDLRSPLVTIRTFQGQLEQDLRSQDAARIEMDLGYIRNAADKMSRLLDELLRLSRVGRMMNPSEEAPLQAVVKEALDLVAGRITARGVRVDLTEEPVVVTGDRTRLVEVFQNLLDNAAKFMGDAPAPRVEIGVEQVGEELVLHVRDNGIGIDPRLQPMLFGLFHKLDPETEGEGIGLALVKQIVELHGGRIWVDSEGPGKGTTFRFTLAKTRRGVGRTS